MVVRVALRAQQAGADRVVVATDDERIKSAVEAHGIAACLTRADHPTGTDRLAEAAQLLGSVRRRDRRQRSGRRAAAFARADPRDGRAPRRASRTPRSPPHAIRSTTRPRRSIRTSSRSCSTSRNYALYFSRATIPWARDAFAGGRAAVPDGLPIYRHYGLYAYRARFLRAYPTLAPAAVERFEALEQLRALWHGFRIVVEVTSGTPAPGVDTPEDLERVRALFASGRVIRRLTLRRVCAESLRRNMPRNPRKLCLRVSAVDPESARRSRPTCD